MISSECFHWSVGTSLVWRSRQELGWLYAEKRHPPQISRDLFSDTAVDNDDYWDFARLSMLPVPLEIVPPRHFRAHQCGQYTRARKRIRVAAARTAKRNGTLTAMATNVVSVADILNSLNSASRNRVRELAFHLRSSVLLPPCDSGNVTPILFITTYPSNKIALKN